MLTDTQQTLLEASKAHGWVLEPDAKRILHEAGLQVPDFRHATTEAAAMRAAGEIGYPLVAKVVSPAVLHKTDVHGVVVGVTDDEKLTAVFSRFAKINGFAGVHLEKMAEGLELIIGAKMDLQFGPVILLGLGGTGVEIYQDVTLRMAPLTPPDVGSMIRSLTGRKLLEGYRGGAPVDRQALTRTLLAFSDLVIEMQAFIESIDLNPVFCSATACVVADARIILR